MFVFNTVLFVLAVFAISVGVEGEAESVALVLSSGIIFVSLALFGSLILICKRKSDRPWRQDSTSE